MPMLLLSAVKISKPFSGADFIDPASADSAQNISQVVSLVRDVVFKDVTGLTNADFTLLAHNQDVIDTALDSGLKVGVSTNDSVENSD